ncbi:MAG: thiaminase II [Actinobacteria bacterium]|nr:thiaminase II [Actinomycetota bacterium]
MSFSSELQSGASQLWESLEHHRFVVDMASGELPLDTFAFYIDQNLLYLPEYARAIAAGITVSRDDAELGWFTDAVRNIVEVEIPENQELRRLVTQLGGKQHPHHNVMAPATLAYTSYLIATAQRSDPLGILALILPCAWSYGDIARARMADCVPHPVYSEWLRFFATDEYDDVVRQLRNDLDIAAQDASDKRRREVADIFLTGIRLESAFWDMAYTTQHWPDLAA